jgi:hypothetical protein
MMTQYLVHKLLLADDQVLLSESEDDLQRKLYNFNNITKHLD